MDRGGNAGTRLEPSHKLRQPVNKLRDFLKADAATTARLQLVF
jgi:hypothetical protein